MKVILDWVANHTSWDNPLTIEHPDWFTKNEKGEFVPPVDDWSDVIDLDYDNPEVRAYMVDALKYWVTDFDIDGYRCDVASMVPTTFWDSARVELDKIKPVYMLAEAQEPEHQIAAFDMSYGWDFHHVMNQVAAGEMPVSMLDSVLNKYESTYPEDYTMMMFTSNHDENSWNGTAPERMGAGLKTFAALTYAVPGMPMIYNGQEARLDKRLEFFEKDPINWGDYPLQDFYSRLSEIKERERAFWHGHNAGSFSRLSSENDHIYAFARGSENSEILCVFNFSGEAAEFELSKKLKGSLFYDLMTSEAWSGEVVELGEWDFKFLKLKAD
jgi:glycosidase